jgi:hypothetical protein
VSYVTAEATVSSLWAEAIAAAASVASKAVWIAAVICLYVMFAKPDSAAIIFFACATLFSIAGSRFPLSRALCSCRPHARPQNVRSLGQNSPSRHRSRNGRSTAVNGRSGGPRTTGNFEAAVVQSAMGRAKRTKRAMVVATARQ